MNVRTNKITAPDETPDNQLALTGSRLKPAPLTGEFVNDAAGVPSMSIVLGNGPGVVKVNAPHVTSGVVKVSVHTVCVGPVMVPSQWLAPKDDDPVQVAAVVPSKLHSSSAVSVPGATPPYFKVPGPSVKTKGRSPAI